jgi:hypothetical protein
MSLNARELGLCELLDLQIPVEFEANRVTVLARIEQLAFDKTAVIPFFLIVTNSKQSDLVGFDWLSQPRTDAAKDTAVLTRSRNASSPSS